MISLKAKVGGIEFRNPFLLASGILDETYYSMKRVWDNEAGAIVTKSISINPSEGYLGPNIYVGRGYVLNAMGLPNPGINFFEIELEKLKKDKIQIIGSIFGSTVEDFVYLAKKMAKYCDAVELNLSCPHVKGVGSEIGSDPDMVYEIVKGIKKEVNIPVWAKLTPNIDNIVKLGMAAQEGGADAVVAINTVRAMHIDIKMKKPTLFNKIGGLSGPAIKPVGIASVYLLKKNLNIPVVGVGGIETIEDVLEYIMAGASAVQIGSAIVNKGVGIFHLLSEELYIYLKENGYDEISSLIGIAQD